MPGVRASCLRFTIVVGLAAALAVPVAAPAGPGALAASPAGAAPPVRQPARELQQAIFDVQSSALSALVNIQPVTETFTRGERTKQSSVGSGFLVDERGYIVTNYHVAGQARQLLVTLSNKERVRAELVGEDPLTDLAVIRIPAEKLVTYKLRPLSFGSSSDLEAGQFVMALGSPLALARSLSFGVVSNSERYLPEGMTLPSGERTGDFNTWIQTDAAINPGNSGGPLIDLQGRVVGVNARGAVFADNIGFAIPADTATRVVRDLIERGQVRRSYAGVQFQPLKDWERLFGLEQARGVVVASVAPGSPAEAAGLQAGDILLSWNGSELTVRFEEELPSLYSAIADTPIGTAVPLRVLRRGSAAEVALTLTTVETGRLMGERFEAESWGFTVKGITDQMVFDLELKSRDGVLIEGVRTGGPAARGKLDRGVVLEAVEGRKVADLDSFKAAYAELAPRGALLLQVRAYETQQYVLLQPGKASEPGEDGTR
jgi:serine protease Do